MVFHLQGLRVGTRVAAVIGSRPGTVQPVVGPAGAAVRVRVAGFRFGQADAHRLVAIVRRGKSTGRWRNRNSVARHADVRRNTRQRGWLRVAYVDELVEKSRVAADVPGAPMEGQQVIIRAWAGRDLLIEKHRRRGQAGTGIRSCGQGDRRSDLADDGRVQSTGGYGSKIIDNGQYLRGGARITAVIGGRENPGDLIVVMTAYGGVSVLVGNDLGGNILLRHAALVVNLNIHPFYDRRWQYEGIATKSFCGRHQGKYRPGGVAYLESLQGGGGVATIVRRRPDKAHVIITATRQQRGGRGVVHQGGRKIAVVGHRRCRVHGCRLRTIDLHHGRETTDHRGNNIIGTEAQGIRPDIAALVRSPENNVGIPVAIVGHHGRIGPGVERAVTSLPGRSQVGKIGPGSAGTIVGGRGIALRIDPGVQHGLHVTAPAGDGFVHPHDNRWQRIDGGKSGLAGVTFRAADIPHQKIHRNLAAYLVIGFITHRLGRTSAGKRSQKGGYHLGGITRCTGNAHVIGHGRGQAARIARLLVAMLSDPPVNGGQVPVSRRAIANRVFGLDRYDGRIGVRGSKGGGTGEYEAAIVGRLESYRQRHGAARRKIGRTAVGNGTDARLIGYRKISHLRSQPAGIGRGELRTGRRAALRRDAERRRRIIRIDRDGLGKNGAVAAQVGRRPRPRESTRRAGIGRRAFQEGDGDLAGGRGAIIRYRRVGGRRHLHDGRKGERIRVIRQIECRRRIIDNTDRDIKMRRMILIILDQPTHR